MESKIIDIMNNSENINFLNNSVNRNLIINFLSTETNISKKFIKNFNSFSCENNKIFLDFINQWYENCKDKNIFVENSKLFLLKNKKNNIENSLKLFSINRCYNYVSSDEDYNSENEEIKKNFFRILIVGDGGCGKKSYISKLSTGDMENNLEKHNCGSFYSKNINFSTNKGPITFECIVCDQESYNFSIVSGVILMFDFSRKCTYKNIPVHHLDIRRIHENIPIILCGNKLDIMDKKILNLKDVIFHRRKELEYYSLSCKTDYNLEKPFLCFAKKFLKDEDIEFL